MERRFADGSALLRVRPWTGRTHQIRLHLKSLGFPVVGERRYSKVSSNDDLPVCLHAEVLRLRHPASREPLVLRAQRPAWAIGDSEP